MTGASPPGLARVGLLAGPALFTLVMLLPPPAGLPPAGRLTAATAVLMAVWRLTEALPLAATALVPLVLFPLLGIASIEDAASPYASPVIFLFLGGFVIAAALEECGLHRRMAVGIIRIAGTRPAGIVGGFMAATASTAFMLPVGTPPNALVYASGRITAREMARAGLALNLLFIVLVTVAAWLLAPVVFGR